MVRNLVILFWIVCISAETAQGQAIDSLQNAVAMMPDDTNRVLTYRHLFRALYKKDQKDDLLDVAEKGLQLSQKLQYERGIEYFIFYKASALDVLGRGNEAIPVFEEGLAMAQKSGTQDAIADYHVNLGTAHHGLGNLDKALENFLAAYHIYKVSGFSDDLSRVLNNIGVLYRTQGKYAQAEQVYKESIALKEVLKDTIGLAASYLNLGTLYAKTQRKEEALSNQQKAIAFYQKLDYQDDVAGCHSLLGEIYFDFGDLSPAKAALEKAASYYQTHTISDYSAVTYQLLGKIAMLEKDTALANKHLHDALLAARKFGQRERIWEILRALSYTENTLGNHQIALKLLHEATIIRDSITEEKRLSILEEMQTKFEVSQKDSQLKINQLDLKQRTLERNWLIGGALLLSLLSLAIFFGLRSRLRANKKIAAQQSELQQQQLIQLEQKSKLAALNAMIEGQEKERSRIANDLHDGLGGLLASVKSHFNALQPPGEQALFAKTNTLIDDACGEVRRIAHNMMPRALSLSGLPAALEDLKQGLEKQGVRCDLEIIGLENSLDPNLSVSIYRIIQELSNNVVKHAQANYLLLQLIQRDGALTIIAEDNGKGFNIDHAKSQKGLGLSSIESRVKFLQGAIEWDSVPEQGTMVSITVPL